MSTQTRHRPSRSKKALVLAPDHPAMVENRPLFKKSANEHKLATSKILISGVNSRKIGRKVVKGRLKGAPIFTLTLKERTTCPSTCAMLASCYGNRMPWAIRREAGEETERRIGEELSDLQKRFPDGFLVRLHVLGDFYSVDYVDQWRKWLDEFPALHVFGYTARGPEDPIGRAVEALARGRWSRFAVRSSGGLLDIPAANQAPAPGIACPAQTSKTECCATCALCWAAPEHTIVFSEH